MDTQRESVDPHGCKGRHTAGKPFKSSRARKPFKSSRAHKQEANFITFNELLDEVLSWFTVAYTSMLGK